ncbi:MAG TPA: ABC transporter ATP-binding protein [Synergistaceae bacterium]|nr:ABC transporter ATP-binding protein [Synergistaceae bacterium]
MIKANRLGFRYSSGSWIFKDYSFHLEKGKALAILGPNGRGKTTLLRCLLGTALPEKGVLAIEGSRGYVPQHAPVSFLSYSVMDMVLMGRIRHMGFFASPGKHDFSKARESLEKLGIPDFAERPFLELSGGERQLVLIARALASECSLLLLDEPTSALDFRNEKMLLNTMKRMKEEGLTLVFTTHAPHQAIHVADTALLMFSPEEYLFGPVEETLSNIHLQRLYGTDIRKIHIKEQGLNVRTIIPVYC